MNKLISTLLLIFSICYASAHTQAAEYNIENIPNVHKQDKNRFVSDPDNLLSEQTRNNVDARLRAMMDSTSVEAAYVIVESIGNADIFDFAQELATKWGIGKKDNNNGLLILIVMDQHKIRFHTGYGLEGVLPDIKARRIIDRDMVPYMRKNNLDAAVEASSKHVYSIMTGNENSEEVRSAMANDDNTENEQAFMALLWFVILLSFSISVLLLLSSLKKCRHQTNYSRSYIIGQYTPIQIVLALTSAGTAIPVLLLTLLLKHHYRNKTIICDVCGGKMRKLNETEDNAYLSPEQDTEEKLNSVDYDVWLCDKCGTTEVFPFFSKHTQYTQCPHCGTRAACLLYDRVEVHPTTLREGRGVKVYGCKYCGHQLPKAYILPKLAVPVIIGGVGGRGGGSSFGGGGGSFGGGSFGGGGATGSW